MQASWAADNEPKATAADIAAAEAALGVKLPDDYKEFISRHGFVMFGRDSEERNLFSYVIEDRGQRETRQRGVSFLLELDKAVGNYRYMTSTEDPEDDSRPMIPEGYLPIASDAGHGRLLLDIAANPGQVWFWPQSEWRWGMEDNRALGFVAESFEAFINGLRPYPL
ncbi:MAG: SMI1/KNR4 family protein [Burkholderiaceae bacterium]